MVRATAAAVLGELKPAGAERALAAAYTAGLADDFYQARAAALTALAKCGAAAATPTLNEALGDRDWAVRARAAGLLRGFDQSSEAASRIRPAPGRPVEAYATPALVAPQVSRTCSSTPTGAPSRSNSPSWKHRSRRRTSSCWRGAGTSAGWPSTASSELRRAGRRSTRRRRRRARLYAARRDQHAARTCVARSGWPSTEPTPAAASSSSRTHPSPTRRQVHRLRPRGGRHGRRGSPAAVGRHPPRPVWDGVDLITR